MYTKGVWFSLDKCYRFCYFQPGKIYIWNYLSNDFCSNQSSLLCLTWAMVNIKSMASFPWKY